MRGPVLAAWRRNDSKALWELVDLEGTVHGWITYEVVYDQANNWDEFQSRIYEVYGRKLPEEAQQRKGGVNG